MRPLVAIYRPLWEHRFYMESLYLCVGMPIAIFWFTVAIAMYAVGLSLVIIWVGVPLVLVAHRSMRWIAASERGFVRSMLDLDIPAPPALNITRAFHTLDDDRTSEGINRFASWARGVVHDVYGWNALLWLCIRIVISPVGFALVIAGFVTVGALLVATVLLLVTAFNGDLAIDNTGMEWLSPQLLAGATFVAIVLVAPMFAWLIRLMADLHRYAADRTLGLCREDRVRKVQARAEVAEERLRIDQELHDSIGHMITMNVIQAGAGAHVFESDPEFARQALRNIEERGRAAMGELDRIIAAIRGDEDPEAERAPLPGIENIESLSQESREAGMTVRTSLDAGSVPDAIGRAAYRVVREALTNAARHAPGADVDVLVQNQGLTLAVEVKNSAPTSAPAKTTRQNSGRGLPGIRDRVALLGGASDVGANDQGGFVVRALFPLGSDLDSQCCLTGDCVWCRIRERMSL